MKTCNKKVLSSHTRQALEAAAIRKAPPPPTPSPPIKKQKALSKGAEGFKSAGMFLENRKDMFDILPATWAIQGQSTTENYSKNKTLLEMQISTLVTLDLVVRFF